jgi:ATP-binding cassette subfamily B protein
MKRYTKLTLKIFWQHSMRYKWRLVFLITFILLASAASIILPLFYKQFFDILTQGGNQISIRSALVHTLYSIAIAQVVQWIFWRFATFANTRFQPRVMKDLNDTCFQYLHRHSFSFFNSNFVGSLVKRVNRFSDAYENVADNIYWYLLRMVVNIVAILIVLFSRKAELGIILSVWIVVFLAINWILTNWKFTYDVRRSQAETKVTGILADTITNQANVKLFNGYQREAQYFANATEKVRSLRAFTSNLDNLFEGVQAGLMVILELAMFYVAIGFWQKGILTTGDFVLIQAYLLSLFEFVWNFGRTLRSVYQKMADAEEMTQVLDTEHEIQDVKNAVDLKVEKGQIEFKNVSFYYYQTRKVISRLNLTIKPREKIALVGPSGAGKSTIIKLILRQHDITSGKIFVDNQNIGRVRQESLWQNISLVPQEPVLFHRTLMENIQYGKPDATKKEVLEAARRAHCHEFISGFPDGYNTFVGERGIKLSGGERQRVAIARAILRNAPILLLDEATSSLDSESEHLIQDALAALMEGKTVVVIAHGLSTIMKMDRIVVIDGGQMVEQGTHAQLLKKKKGLYHRLWKFQAGGFIE